MSPSELREFYRQLLSRHGVYPGEAEMASNGLMRSFPRQIAAGEPPLIASIMADILSGDIDPRANRIALLETPTTLVLDASSGIGPTAGIDAVSRAIDKAAALGSSIVYVQRCRLIAPVDVLLGAIREAGLEALMITSRTARDGEQMVHLAEGELSVKNSAGTFWSEVNTALEEGTSGQLDRLSEQIGLLLRAARLAQRIGRLGTQIGPRGEEFCIAVHDNDESERLRGHWSELISGVDAPADRRPLELFVPPSEDQPLELPDSWKETFRALSNRHHIPLPGLSDS